MPITMQLASLVAGRDLADRYVDQLGDVHDEVVLVDARELTNGTSSFAAQLVDRVLVVGAAKRLVVVGAPGNFVQYLRSAAIRDEVSPKLDTVATMELATAS